MNAERLLQLYDRVSEAPDAIPRLRRFILNLAVCGRLVEHSPHDEPTSLLRERIINERDRLTKAGKFREPRNAVEIDRERLPFSVPARWSWVRLIDIASVNYGFAFASSRFNNEKRGVPLIRIRDISKSDTEAYYDGDFDSAYVVSNGDYLVGMDGDFNLRCWQGKQALLNQRVMRISDWKCEVCPEFIKLPLQFVLDFLHSYTSQTTVKHLSAKQVNGIEIPLPPLAEQHRIAAKVDELMALCNSLEAEREKRERARDRLTTASLSRLTTPDVDEKQFKAHADFAIKVLPELTTWPDQIKALRQTMLNLAVRGKLVEQDPNDEPALDTVDRIGRLPLPARYSKRSPELIAGQCGLSVNRPDMDLPHGWDWIPLVYIARIESGHTPSRSRPDWWDGNIPWLGLVDARAHNNGRIFDTIQHTNEAGLANSAARLLPEGTVCFSRTASVGYVVTLGRPMATSQDFVNWVPSDAVSSEWLQLVLIAERPSIPRFTKGAVHQTIYYPAWLSMHIALPPLREQQRIVSKVNELNFYCDQMSEELIAGYHARGQLLEALLTDSLQRMARC